MPIYEAPNSIAGTFLNNRTAKLEPNLAITQPLARIAHKSIEIFERCRLWQRAAGHVTDQFSAMEPEFWLGPTTWTFIPSFKLSDWLTIS
jgi:hypothetical protein